MNNKELLERLAIFIAQDGPTYEDFDEFTVYVNKIAELIRENRMTHQEITSLKSRCDFLQDDTSIMGHIINKPYGYAGDFHIIDRIYTRDVSTRYPKWDKFSLSNSAAQAVRNRKDYFKTKVTQTLAKGGLLLNIASGPARDLYELYTENPHLNISTTCVEMDENAIKYAKKLNERHLEKTTFIKKNIFRFNTDHTYDMIWSAGLFDYFDDKAFILLLRKFRDWVKEDGEIIIGNFNENYNPSRAFMEIFGEWYLNHRTEEQLYYLAKQAGFEANKIHVGHEPENVNLFLHLKK